MENKNNAGICLISLFSLDLGVRYISSFLKKNGYRAHIILFNKKRSSLELLGNNYFNAGSVNHKICDNKDLSLLITLLKKLNARVIGISLSSTTFQTAKAITLEIKKQLDVLVVWGGVHAIICPEECIKYADIVCVGEGERPMLELAEKLKTGQPVSGIKNLWIKKENGIEKNEGAPLIDNLDELPFPDFLESDNKFLIDSGKIGKEHIITTSYLRDMYPIISSRGCLYGCSFCCNSVLRKRYEGRGRYVRRRSVENVIAELKFAVENGQFNKIRFWDDIFTFEPEWINKFCDQYIKEISKPFICYAHPRCVNSDILLKLKNAGLEAVYLGIQSGSEDISNQLFSRQQLNQDILGFANFIKKIGVTARYDIISDDPYETDRDQEATVDLLTRLPYPFQVQLYSLCWFPETPLTNKALEDGKINSQDLEQYSSKALNNFYINIPSSKTKKYFFWNCIKSMSVNRIFPVYLVRFCKNSQFFKKHPKLLFFLAKNYILLFSRFRLTLKNGRVNIAKVIPINTAQGVIFFDKESVSNNFISGPAKWIFRNPIVSYSFFVLPASRGKDGNVFCLRIRNRLPQEKYMNFIVSLHLFGSNSPNKAVWSIGFPVGSNPVKDVHIKLLYPELTCFSDKYQYAARLVKGEFPSIPGSNLYLLNLSDSVEPRVTLGSIVFST